MKDLSSDNQADVIKAFNSTSRYFDDLLNIDNPYFEGMVNQIYPSELQLNKANTSDTEAPFLDLHLFISNGFVSSKIYDKRDDFDFDIVNFPFLDVAFLLCLCISFSIEIPLFIICFACNECSFYVALLVMHEFYVCFICFALLVHL